MSRYRMDMEFSKKVGFTKFLEKLLGIRQPNWPLGATYFEVSTQTTYVYVGEGVWFRVV